MSHAGSPESQLGTYLRDRRTRLDPASFGLPLKRRRTPGLRREEVAQRANVSATWYTWLEQGRGGAPSADVLDRIARALLLTPAEREHLFLLGLGHPPEYRYRETAGVTPRLQRVLDALELSPAIVKTPTWEVVAWNRAATVMFKDYDKLPPEQRNILRMMFTSAHVREAQLDWDATSRFVVAAFRADVARAGASGAVQALVNELCATSADFARLWGEIDVLNYEGGTKTLRHPSAGLIEMEFSSFAVDGRPDLGMIVYNPATPEDAAKMRALIKGSGKGGRDA
jgi:transcriptional regulator with XRE-family HTH domain